MYFMFLFFQQNTAYDGRISDLSSDVCSSDPWSGRGRASSCAWVPGCCAPVAARSPHADSATAQYSAQATTRSFGVMDMRASAMQVDDHDAALDLRAALCVDRKSVV